MTEKSVIAQIAAGDLDGQLDAIITAIRTRRKYVSQQKALDNQAAFTPGTRVVVARGIKPKYLIGITGTVSTKPGRRSGDLMVDIDEAHWPLVQDRFGRSVGVPANCLDRAA